MINVKNHQKYSDSLTLHVVDLSHIELATGEDKQYHIHEWAMLFKADTWEEYYQDLRSYERAIEEIERLKKH